MKVFISQPMNGVEDSEVLRIRGEVTKYLQEKYGDIEVLQTFIYDDPPQDAGRLWYLAKSIQMLGQADRIYFVDGWQNAKGCIVESLIASLYGIKTID